MTVSDQLERLTREIHEDLTRFRMREFTLDEPLEVVVSPSVAAELDLAGCPRYVWGLLIVVDETLTGRRWDIRRQ